MRTTLVVLFFVNVIQKRAIVTKCKVSFKIGSNPRTMPLCYAMLGWAKSHAIFQTQICLL